MAKRLPSRMPTDTDGSSKRADLERSFRRRVAVRRRPVLERLDDRRVLAAITGAVFHDLNQSLQQDADEPFAASRLVFLDTNANGTLDVGEPLTIADGAGAFSFEGLADGTYEVRVFDGTTTQQQTFPVEAETPRLPVAIAGGTALIASQSSNGGLVLTADAVVAADIDGATASSVPVGNQLLRMQSLPDGRLLVIGGGDPVSGDTAWVVDGTTSTPADLSVSGATLGNSGLAIDGDGRGVLLVTAADDSSLLVRSVDASDISGSIVVGDTGATVPIDTRAIASSTGVRSVLASPSADGLLLSLWSNSAGQPIPGATDIAGVTDFLAFDDAAGILVLRTIDGGASVHDVNDNFQQLDVISGSIGAVMVDPSRDLLIAYDSTLSALQVISLRDATRIATLPVDLSAVGDVVALAEGAEPDSFLVLGSAGLHEIKLNRPAAHRVTIVDGVDADPIAFGVLVIGVNAAPGYEALPTLEVDEDETLALPAGATLAGSVDVDDSAYVIVQQSDAANGVATLNIDGSITYVPDDDFFGADTITVILHDGQDASEPITLTIDVRPVPDSPTDVIVDVHPIPEDAPIGLPVGGIRIIDVDGGGHVVQIDDPRFGPVVNADGGIDIVILTGPLDFETEPFIPLTITVSDPETFDVIERSVTLRIDDANDPITGILPTEAFVFENSPGDVITGLVVLDQDAEQTHTFTVDDERFIVEEYDLRLVDGVAVDFETEPVIIVNVTATEVGTGGSFTQAITIRVRDVPEQPMGLTLTDRTVVEFTSGDGVGEVKIDGGDPDPRFILTVDDSRFEVVDGTLKLKADEFVVQAVEPEIEITITAQDSVGQFNDIERSFLIEVLANDYPLHNREDPFDVDHSGDVTAADVLAIINYLNTYGPGPVGSGDMGYCYDVNADGFVTALDALLVINKLNQRPSVITGGEGDGEGEQVPAPQTVPPPQVPTTPLRGMRIADVDDLGEDDLIVEEVPLDDVIRDATFAVWRPSGESDAVAEAIESLDGLADSDEGSLDLLSRQTS
jgi:hypothetical protein